MATIYRNYDVARVGDIFAGQSSDDESLLISRSQSRLMTAIDQMWDGLEHGQAPTWFSGSSAIDLDAVELNEASPESVPSETDPPQQKWHVPYWLFGLAALGVSAPAAFVMDYCSFEARVDVMLTLGVCAVAIVFGRGYALLLAALSGPLVNFFAVEPLLEFTKPTWSEAANVALNFVAAYAIPAIIKHIEGRRAPKA